MSDDKHTLTVTMKGDTAGYHGLKNSKQTQCGRIYEAKQENLQDIPCIYFLTDKREPRKHQSKLISEASKLKLWTSRARRDKFQLVSEAVFLQNHPPYVEVPKACSVILSSHWLSLKLEVFVDCSR
jgi:hypothetical protein